jgi:hypothetical protein
MISLHRYVRVSLAGTKHPFHLSIDCYAAYEKVMPGVSEKKAHKHEHIDSKPTFPEWVFLLKYFHLCRQALQGITKASTYGGGPT